jgi:hypothetical protein
MKTLNLSLIIVILMAGCYSTPVYSQKSQGLEMEGNMLYMDVGDSFSFDFAMKYAYWLNPYIGFSYGGTIGAAKFDKWIDSPTESNVYYSLDGSVVHLNGILSLKLSSPVYKRIGATTDFNFLFEPIPFGLASIEKNRYDPNKLSSDTSTKYKAVYTRFNPSYSIQFGLFYEIEGKRNSKTRLSLGCGITNFNPYNTYYLATIDNIPLKNHMKLRPDDLGIQLFIRLSNYK